jgi:heterodisulfide reductase subunit B
MGELQQSIPIAARNMAIGEELGGNILVSCNGCYKMLRDAKRLISELQLIKEINNLLSAIGRSYQGTASIYHVGELLYKKHATIRDHIIRELGNLTIAAQYGCHYLKSFHKSAIDDVKQPRFLEDLINVAGANPVAYPERLLCCGAGATVRFLKRRNALMICREKLRSIQKAGADAIVVICPYCLLHLDRAQQELKAVTGEAFEIPVIHISQLLALAMGIERKKLGFRAHITPVDSLIEKINA